MYSSNNLYYLLKSFIPRPAQIYLRRILIQRKISSYRNIWPIDPASATPPENWQGWPEGKKFAFVLTHDVETSKGLLNCQALMDIEEKYGFRSSFNFVAGDYPIPGELTEEMKRRGFEVGIHGLHHNGNLFRSRKVFSESATQINHALKKYSAVGFRSPSMYHNLEWLHDLDIEYDASTFDTDPFEPQPDGLGTIFPIWIAGSNHQKGYVELPYTLCQDFLAFVMLRQKNIDIWETKLNWIVQNGGMALVNVHPDYISVTSDHFKSDEYPLKYYSELLQYVKTNFENEYWQVLPRDLARFWKNNYTPIKNGMM